MSSHTHKNFGPKVIKQAEILNVDIFDIFPTTVFSGNLNVDNNEILNECYRMKHDDPEGNQRSNFKGWQSKLQSLQDIICWADFPIISDLGSKAIQFANIVMEDIKYNIKFREDSCAWWVNVNNKFSYNVLHSHPKTDLIAVYYPKIISKNQGEITLIRTDGSLHHELYSEVPEHCYYKLSVEEGRIYFFPAHLLHYVNQNETDEERVSISFNIFL